MFCFSLEDDINVTKTPKGEGTATCTDSRARRHTLAGSYVLRITAPLQIGAAELISILAYVAIYPSIYILHPPISNCRSVLCGFNPRFSVRSIDTSNSTTVPSITQAATLISLTQSDLYVLAAYLYAPMRLPKPITRHSHVAEDPQ
jgi:hypothetical protein